MTNSAKFVGFTHIKATPEKVWNAITDPAISIKYWGNENISDWQQGSLWRHVYYCNNKRKIKFMGIVLEVMPHKSLTLTWVDPRNPKDKSRVNFTIESISSEIRLKIIHSNLNPESLMFNKIRAEWPHILSNMKLFLETGRTVAA